MPAASGKKKRARGKAVRVLQPVDPARKGGGPKRTRRQMVVAYKLVSSESRSFFSPPDTVRIEYVPGKTYYHDGKPKVCKAGLHCSKTPLLCGWSLRGLSAIGHHASIRLLVVRARVDGTHCDRTNPTKMATNEMEIVREVKGEEFETAGDGWLLVFVNPADINKQWIYFRWFRPVLQLVRTAGWGYRCHGFDDDCYDPPYHYYAGMNEAKEFGVKWANQNY